MILNAVDLMASSFVFGTTVWFFFIQSPVLLKRMGRDQFVPLQMRLTVVLFRALTVAMTIATAATVTQAGTVSSPAVLASLAALMATVINKYIVVPRALIAGGRGLKEVRGRDAEASVAKFNVEGVGSATTLLHRMVVLFVVLMLAGVVAHLYFLLAGLRAL